MIGNVGKFNSPSSFGTLSYFALEINNLWSAKLTDQKIAGESRLNGAAFPKNPVESLRTSRSFAF